MDTWRKHAAVRDWFTPGKKSRAIKFLAPEYGKEKARRWLHTFAHKYKQSAFQGHNPQHLNPMDTTKTPAVHPLTGKTWKVEPDLDKFIAVSTDGKSVFGRTFATEEDAQTVANCMHNITKLRSERDELLGALRDAKGMVTELALAKLFPATVINEDYVNKKVDEYTAILSKHKPE